LEVTGIITLCGVVLVDTFVSVEHLLCTFTGLQSFINVST